MSVHFLIVSIPGAPAQHLFEYISKERAKSSVEEAMSSGRFHYSAIPPATQEVTFQVIPGTVFSIISKAEMERAQTQAMLMSRGGPTRG